ncbi:MAG: cysteine--tRNA ligase [Mollicutes bacterium]|nr:cysteine--tRNA ligase [Mollicutes bacterium]MDY5875782.1 cysteine--tRNA ligase [Bacilli bacterium]
MKLYNTLTRKVEEFVPNEDGKVKLYTCGPTVYHYAHIGNIRNYIGHDILDKTLRYLGYDVTRAMNITDVGHLTSDSDSGEDKMEVARKREHKSSMEIAKFYTDAFFEDFSLVNCKMPEIVSPATENIDMYIKIIEKLLKDEYAYISGGNVYFDISKLNDYYVLTNHQEDDLVVGARDGVEEDSNKRNQADFALWFTTSKFENHELLWDSPWGKGYPGWHIECSGISIKYLGEHLDIHGGGVDNIFPHHTNEIAQSEAYLGHKWCNYWFHNEHLLDQTGKMSKSKGAILTVTKLKENGFDPLAFRFMCLNSHYRKQLVFSYDALTQAESTLKKLRNKIKSLSDSGELDRNLYKIYNNKFILEISNDLNTANAITVIYELLKDSYVSDKTKISLITSFDEVLSLNLISNEEENLENDAYIKEKIAERNEAKKNKNYVLADEIRDNLLKEGIKLIDTREGTIYEIIKD